MFFGQITMIFRLVCLWKLIILFPSAMYDFNNFMSLNACASKVATSAVIVKHSLVII